MSKYILYARKSTDVEDKQVLSIDAQIVELKEFAKKMELEIVDILIEKRTAKTLGRPVFNKMLERIKDGEADGILAWLPDRLSRNSIDSGQIIYMLDENVLTDLKFPHFWFENTPQGKYMLANEFNSSKQYVDNLSVNTKRGLRAKIRAGICPRIAPLGYSNDLRTKTIVVNDKTAWLARSAFFRYSAGDQTLDEISEFLLDKGVKTRGGKRWPADRVKSMLVDVFYVGLFKYGGEIYEGKHEAIIDKGLFDRVQEVLSGRGRPNHKKKTCPPPLCRLVRCAFCGCYITGSLKTKRQKNGNEHFYTYYRCSHRKRGVICRQPELREYALAGQLVKIVRGFAMPANWGDFLLERLAADELVNKNVSEQAVAELNAGLDEVSSKIKRLFDVYLDGDIEQGDYRARRAELLSDKRSFEYYIERVLVETV
jgi:DNA invertase Pin-like site-specific DNA recombinase